MAKAKAAEKPKTEKPSKPPTMRALQEQLQYAEAELALQESRYIGNLFKQLQVNEQRILQEAELAVADPDENKWSLVSSGRTLTDNKWLAETNRDPRVMRRQAYRFWRLHPHGRSILRNFQRFIIGREFGFDFADEQHGTWNEDKTKLMSSESEDNPLLVRLVWDDFAKRNRFIQRAKEIVLRTFRDGECFLRQFVRKGRVNLRFIEAEWVRDPATDQKGTVQPDDLAEDNPDREELVGKETVVHDGIEHLASDIETVIAYWIQVGTAKPERVPAKDVIHTKPFADSNDLRGIPLLEVVAKRLTNYDTWEDYRMILNKIRTAIAMVRKVEGSSAQAAAIIAARSSPRSAPSGREPVTTSGRREAMFSGGTILTPNAGVSYEFLSPNLDAKDASEDGRRFLLSIAAGVGLPEMLVTGDWSNANYASSVESRTPAVREWEDWQDFFEPVFKQLFKWVVDAAKDGLGMPEETSDEVAVQWPSLISKDNLKETERNVALHDRQIMSKTTWAAREDLIYEEELDNMRMEAELEGAHAATSELPPEIPDEEEEEPEPGRRRPFEPTLEGQLRVATAELDALMEAVDSSIEDPKLKQAMAHYIKTAHAMINKSRGRVRLRKQQRRWRASAY